MAIIACEVLAPLSYCIVFATHQVVLLSPRSRSNPIEDVSLVLRPRCDCGYYCS